MKVFITKYALSAGIQEEDVEICREDVSMCSYRTARMSCDNYLNGNEFHKTREEAVRHAESMRVKKIASLQKQLAKLEKLKFQ